MQTEQRTASVHAVKKDIQQVLGNIRSECQATPAWGKIQPLLDRLNGLVENYFTFTEG
jgi:hypothetical protein